MAAAVKAIFAPEPESVNAFPVDEEVIRPAVETENVPKAIEDEPERPLRVVPAVAVRPMVSAF